MLNKKLNIRILFILAIASVLLYLYFLKNVSNLRISDIKTSSIIKETYLDNNKVVQSKEDKKQVQLIEIDDKLQQNQFEYYSSLISAFYDINRVGRAKEKYFEWIKQTQKLNAPFIFFVQKKYEDIILNLFKNRTKPY
jgi:hypothetical protein